MKKILVLILLLSSLPFIVLHSQVDLKEMNPEIKRNSYQKLSRVVSGPASSNFMPFEVKPGKNWVFKYYYKAKDMKEVADDEFAESVMFEIKPTKGKAFRIKGDLSSYHVVYNQMCFCADGGSRFVKTGTITGRYMNGNQWQVSMDLNIPPRDSTRASSYKKQFKGVFKLGQID